MVAKKRKKKRRARIPKPKSEPQIIHQRVSDAERRDSDMTLLLTQQRQFIGTIEELRKSKLIVMVLKDGVMLRDGLCRPLHEQLRTLGKLDRLDLFLPSMGGRTEVPLKVVTLLRSFGMHIGALVPYRANSAATHIAIGADEIIMGDLSELSSVDARRTHPLLPPNPEDPDKPLGISVQDLRHCMEFIKKEAGGDLSPEAMVGVYQPLFEKVHPLAVGALEQSYGLARQVTRKILQTHMDPEKDEEKIERLASLLSDHYKSHVLQIGWREARDYLGLNVVYDDGDLYEAMIKLLELYEEAFQEERAIDMQIAGRSMRGLARPTIWLDTSASRCRLEESLHRQVTEEGIQENIIGHRWVTEDWSPQPQEKSPGEAGAQP